MPLNRITSFYLNFKILVLFFFAPILLAAQVGSLSDSFVLIEKLTIEGNKKTKGGTIFRELEFVVGDSLPAAGLPAALERNRLRLMNLGIFSESSISVANLNC